MICGWIWRLDTYLPCIYFEWERIEDTYSLFNIFCQIVFNWDDTDMIQWVHLVFWAKQWKRHRAIFPVRKYQIRKEIECNKVSGKLGDSKLLHVYSNTFLKNWGLPSDVIRVKCQPSLLQRFGERPTSSRSLKISLWGRIRCVATSLFVLPLSQ